MILSEILDRVRYPDEQVATFDDRIPYEDVVKGLEEAQRSDLTRSFAAPTLIELQRRWSERQKLNN